MNKGRVKKFLDELEVPDHQRAEILLEADTLAIQAGATRPGRLWGTLLAVLMIPTCATRFLLSHISSFQLSVVGITVAIAAIYGALKLNSAAWWQFYRPHLIKPLADRGFRYCPQCLYNLRGLPLETEYCPECSVYISKRSAAVRTALDVRIVHPSTIPKDVKRVVTGIEISPAQQEEILALMFPQNTPKKKRTAGWSWAGIIVLIITLVVLQRKGVAKTLNVPLVITLVLAGVFAAFIGLLIVKIYIQIKQYPKRFRSAARQIGIEVCMQCGRYLGELESSHTACSQCQAPRLPMR